MSVQNESHSHENLATGHKRTVIQDQLEKQYH